MVISRWVGTVLLLGLCFTGNTRGLPANTSIDCETPLSIDLPARNEEYQGVVEFVTIPQGAEIFLESPSCPVCVSFLELNYTVGDASASVITKKPLDADALRDSNTSFDGSTLTYSITCESNATIRNYRTLVLYDINDNAPVFEEATYTANVSESKPVTSLVIQVKAFDADISSYYHTFSYSIESPTTTFEILPNGSIILKERLKYTVSKHYNLTVKAKDQNCNTGETTVIINVLETPGLHFEHNLYNARIPENEVGRFRAIHPAPIKAFDGDHEIIYSIRKVSPGEFWENFAIEKETGVINVEKELDREKASFINMTITASLKNDSMKTANATVVVSVDNVNEPPVFSERAHRAEIFSVVPAGYPVVAVKATDPDVGETLSYSLVEASSMFAVEPSSGQVYVVSVAGESGKVNLQVKVEDQQGLHATTTVEVTVVYCSQNNVMEILLNMPVDSVMNKAMKMERALERALNWTVRIIRISSEKARSTPLSRSSSHQTYVDFIALTHDNVTMPKDDVETRLTNEEQKVLTELQAVFGPDVDYDMVGDERPPWFSIMTILLGVLGALSCISLIHLGVTRMRKRRQQRRRDSKDDMPTFWTTGWQGNGPQHATEMQRIPPHMIHSARFHR